MPDVDLEEFDPPDRPDFRRVGRGIPFVLDPSGKRTRYSRSSNAGKVLDDDSNLTDWKLRTVVAGAAQRPELMAAASVLDPDTEKKALRDIAEDCLIAGKGQRRSIIGTAVHAMFDHVDRRDGWVAPPQFAELVQAYVDALELWGLVPVGIELHCVNDAFRLAGTLDRHYRTTKALVAPDGQVISIGSILVGDIKTGRELEYASGSYATQLAAYVDSVEYNVATDERSPFEHEPNRDWALIVHADSSDTRVEMYWVDIAAGREGLALAHAVREWRKRNDLLTLGKRITLDISLPSSSGGGADVAPVPAPDEGERSAAAPLPIEGERSAPAPLGLALAPESPGEPPTVPAEVERVRDRTEYLRGRVRAVLEHGETTARAMQRAWPEGIPGLKAEGHSMDTLDAIEEAVEKVETDQSVPFHPPWVDPALEESKLSHPSNVWAKGERGKPADRETIRDALVDHPRAELVKRWIAEAKESKGIDQSIDHTPLAHALYEFARVDPLAWPDGDISIMLDGTLRAMGYPNGRYELGHFDPAQAPLLMTAVFAIVAGTSILSFNDEGQPVVIFTYEERKLT